MHNLAVEDIPLALTEFGVKSGGFGTVPTRQARAAQILEETMRLVFGMPGTTGFNMWGFWEGEVWSGAPEGVLYNTDWSIRPAGVRWQMLMDEWSTNLDLVVGADGTIDSPAFAAIMKSSWASTSFLFLSKKLRANTPRSRPGPVMPTSTAACTSRT